MIKATSEGIPKQCDLFILDILFTKLVPVAPCGWFADLIGLEACFR